MEKIATSFCSFERLVKKYSYIDKTDMLWRLISEGWYQYDTLGELFEKKAAAGDPSAVVPSYELPVDAGADAMREAAAMAKKSGVEIIAYKGVHELGIQSPDALAMKLSIVGELGCRNVIFTIPDDDRLGNDSPEYKGLAQRLESDFGERWHVAAESDWKDDLAAG